MQFQCPTAWELSSLKSIQNEPERTTEWPESVVYKLSAHSVGIPFSGSHQTVSLGLHLVYLEGHLGMQHAMVSVN